ncbi:hypothetical protein V2G26_018077 [Clonostachys chloroleuca]
MRKRAFWCAFGIDCYAALILGRPLGNLIQEVDAEFPLDIDDSNITETDILGEPRSPDDRFSTTNVNCTSCLSTPPYLGTSTLVFLYSGVSSNMDNTASDDRIALFRAEIDAWIASTPPIPP